ncbi:MAG: hypothetical protein J0L62_11220 [Bacteroidetes bacterium]|nr:hypothetical protein [Bacteroidota bacterium]
MSSLPSAVLPEIADYLDCLYSLSPIQPETPETQEFYQRDIIRFLQFVSSSLSIQHVLVSTETDQSLTDVLNLLFDGKMVQQLNPESFDLVISFSEETLPAEQFTKILGAGKKGSVFVIGHLPDSKEMVQQWVDTFTASGLKGSFLPVGKGLWFGTKL